MRYKRKSGKCHRSPSPTSRLSGAWVGSRDPVAATLGGDFDGDGDGDGKKKLRLFRNYEPQDLWEVGCLKKALGREIDVISSCASSCGTGVGSGFGSGYGTGEGAAGDEKPENEHDVDLAIAKLTLIHILNCWIANVEWNTEIKRQQSAGPAFLIHVLGNRYADEDDAGSGFWGLDAGDRKLLDALMECCAQTGVFHLFLARFLRVAYSTQPGEIKADSASTNDDETPRCLVDRTDCVLDDVMHAGGREVKIYPRVSEDDLIDPYFFEDQPPDLHMREGGTEIPVWRRMVVILAPDVFVDEFFGYEQQKIPPGWRDPFGHQNSEQNPARQEMMDAGIDDKEIAGYIKNMQTVRPELNDLLTGNEEEQEEIYVEDEEAMVELALQELAEHQASAGREAWDEDDEAELAEVTDALDELFASQQQQLRHEEMPADSGLGTSFVSAAKGAAEDLKNYMGELRTAEEWSEYEDG